MNNLRLLTGWCAAVLLSCEVCVATAADPVSQTEPQYNAQVFTLPQLYEYAENSGVHLRPSLAAEKQAMAEIEEAKTARLPEIEASLSLSFIGDGFTTKRNFSDYQKAQIPHFGNNFGINVNQPVWTGGAITKGIELASLGLTASRYATELNRDNIRFSVTELYLNIYKYTNLCTVVEKNIAQARDVLTQMQSRHEQGMALHNDITRYELLVSNLELQLIKIANMLKILNENMLTLTGLPKGTVVRPDTAILGNSIPYTSENQWCEAALEASPTIRLAESKMQISRKTQELAETARLPKIGLQAAYSLEGPILVEVPPINRNLSYWYVGVGVSYNLSSLFKTDKSVAKARAAYVIAADELEVEKQDTELAVRSEYVRYLEAYEELKTQEKSVELANSNYSVVNTRYNAGMALITDMLDAANSVLDAEQQLVNARINILYYYYKLLFISSRI